MAQHTPPPIPQDLSAAMDTLMQVMNTLRVECPWDRKQTLHSLRDNTIEETYELVDALNETNYEEIKKELGDLLLHIVFYSKICEEQGAFSFVDVVKSLLNKLITRHPHVYGDAVADTPEEVNKNWQKIKLQEGNRSALSGVPKALPSLNKAMRVQQKAREMGFDWENKEQVWDKVLEELDELKAECDKGPDNREKAEGELGDLLFSVVNYARFEGINPDDALEKTNRKFIRRFMYMEEKIKEHNKDMQQMTLTEMDSYWDEAKKLEG